TRSRAGTARRAGAASVAQARRSRTRPASRQGSSACRHSACRPLGGYAGRDYDLLIVIFLIVTGVVGLSPGSFGTRAICLTRSTSLHWPKIVCFPLSQSGPISVMKNWLPFVPPPSGVLPAFAI